MTTDQKVIPIIVGTEHAGIVTYHRVGPDGDRGAEIACHGLAEERCCRVQLNAPLWNHGRPLRIDIFDSNDPVGAARHLILDMLRLAGIESRFVDVPDV